MKPYRLPTIELTPTQKRWLEKKKKKAGAAASYAAVIRQMIDNDIEREKSK